MKNKLIIAITIALSTLSSTQIFSYPSYSAEATKDRQKTKPINITQKKVNNYPKTKKPEYYHPGHSDGLQNYPGKTIDAGMNTGMLPTNSASHSGNDVSF